MMALFLYALTFCYIHLPRGLLPFVPPFFVLNGLVSILVWSERFLLWNTAKWKGGVNSRRFWPVQLA